MGLEDIIRGIDAQAKEHIERLEHEAKQERERILKEAKKEAGEREEEILLRRSWEGEEEYRRAIIHLRQEEKRKMLALKSQLMDKAFQAAYEAFTGTGDKEYRKLMRDALLASIGPDAEEVLFSPGDKKVLDEDFLKDVQAKLARQSKDRKLKFSFSLPENERGFVIRGRDMEINGTLSSLFSTVKDREEIEVARLLFG